jgi:hypothetical protein
MPRKYFHIEVVSYRGKNGGFATRHIPMWAARIIGADGRKRDLSGAYGHSDERHAMVEAEDWAKLLGCKVIRTTGPENLSGSIPYETTPIPVPVVQVDDGYVVDQNAMEGVFDAMRQRRIEQRHIDLVKALREACKLRGKQRWIMGYQNLLHAMGQNQTYGHHIDAVTQMYWFIVNYQNKVLDGFTLPSKFTAGEKHVQ